MIVRSCSWKPRTANVVGLWGISRLVGTKRWASQHVGGALGGLKHHKCRANPWNPTPYQWAPLPETGHDLTDGALQRKDYGKFVQFFRQASPYIEGHRGRTFVVVIPGEVWLQSIHLSLPRLTCYNATSLLTLQVILQRPLLQSQLKDIQLLHGKCLKSISFCSLT